MREPDISVAIPTFHRTRSRVALMATMLSQNTPLVNYLREHSRMELLALQALARWQKASAWFRRLSGPATAVLDEATAATTP